MKKYKISLVAVILVALMLASCEIEPDKYTLTITLTLEVNPSHAGTADGAGEYEEGETASLSATPNEGYEFVNWTDEQDAEVSTDASFQYTMPGNDFSLTANFTEIFDESLIAGKWQSGTLYFRYFDSGEGYTWDEGDDMQEYEAQIFTWTLIKSELTHIYQLEIGGTISKLLTVTELSSTHLRYRDNFGKNYSFTKVND